MIDGSAKWTETAIGDLGRVVTGKTPPTSELAFFGDVYPFFTPTDIQNGLRIIEPERGLSAEGRQYLKNYLLPPNTVCFVCIGATIGKVCMTSQPSFTNQQINSIVADPERHDANFIYYLLRHNAELIKVQASGAATPIISKTAFMNIKLTVPPLPIQRKIAGVLSAYDYLIENNMRRIKLLEQAAQALYNEWFVDFRFPGHENAKMVDSELGPIPEGWKANRLGEVAEVIDCLHSRKPTEVKSGEEVGGILLQVWNIGDEAKLDLTKRFLISQQDYSLWTSRVEVRAGDCVITNVGRIGAVAQIPKGVKAAIGRNMTSVRARDDAMTPAYLIEYLRSPYYEREKRVKQDPGTVMGSLNVRGIVKLLVPIPPISLMLQFDRLVSPIRRRIEILQEQTAVLLETRDLLLPRLVSGKVDISSLDIHPEGPINARV